MKIKKLKLSSGKKVTLSKKEEFLLIFLCLLLLVVVFGKLLLIPLMDEWEVVKERSVVLQGEYNNVKSSVNNFEKKQKLLKETEQSFQEKIGNFPSSPSTAKLLLDIKSIGDKNLVKIETVSLGKNDINKNFYNTGIEMGEQEVTLNISGEYNNLMNFIKDSEGISRIGMVNSITLSNKDTNELNAILNIKFCYFPMGKDKEIYDFNNRTYGKENPFK